MMSNVRLTDSSLPPTILSGVVWHNSPGLFSRWRQVFLILNRDTLRWHHIHKTSSINHHQVGPTIASLNLILISDVSFVERKGYLTICIEAGGVGSNFFRRTSMLRYLIYKIVVRQNLINYIQALGRTDQGSCSEEERRVWMHQFVWIVLVLIINGRNRVRDQ